MIELSVIDVMGSIKRDGMPVGFIIPERVLKDKKIGSEQSFTFDDIIVRGTITEYLPSIRAFDVYFINAN